MLLNGSNLSVICEASRSKPLLTMNYTLYSQIAWAWIAVAIVTFLYLLRQNAPYGRHVQPGWGPTVDNRLGWFVMEFTVIVVFLTVLLWPGIPSSKPVWVFSAEGLTFDVAVLPYDALRQAHIADHAALFGRVALDLGRDQRRRAESRRDTEKEESRHQPQPTAGPAINSHNRRRPSPAAPTAPPRGRPRSEYCPA